MDFTLTPEQQLLSDGLDKFLDARYDLQVSRDAAKVGEGWQPKIWKAFVEDLGVVGACLPEDIGGFGGGPEELMVVTEALGHALVVEPFVRWTHDIDGTSPTPLTNFVEDRKQLNVGFPFQSTPDSVEVDSNVQLYRDEVDSMRNCSVAAFAKPSSTQTIARV